MKTRLGLLSFVLLLTIPPALSLVVAAQTAPGNLRPPDNATRMLNAVTTDGSPAVPLNTRIYGAIKATITISGTATVNFEGRIDTSQSFSARKAVKESDTTNTIITSTATSGDYIVYLAGDEEFNPRVSGCLACTVTVWVRQIPSVGKAIYEDGGGGAPVDAAFITQTPNATLTNEQALSTLSTGLVKNTTTTGVLSIAGASDLPSAIDASKIADGSVSNAEFQRLDGVTSGIQSQIDGKQGTLTNSAGLRAALSDELGTGAALFDGATPTGLVLTNATGLPLTTGVTGVLPGANGGTGVANTGSTITLGGNLIHAGAFNTTITSTATTNSTLPSGTHTLAGLDVAQSFAAVQTISLNSASIPAGETGTLLNLGNADGVISRVEQTAFAAQSFFSARRANGTAASPTALVTDDQIGAFNFGGYQGSNGYSGPQASLAGYATANWSNTSNPTYLAFKTTPAASVTMAEQMRIHGSGGVSIGNTTDPGATNLKVTGSVTGASFNGNTFTAGTYTLTGTAAKTLNFTNTLTLSGTDGSTLNIGAGGTLGSNAFLSTAFATLTNNTFTRGQAITQGTANESILLSTGGSNTGSNAASAFDLSWTLNTSGSPDMFALRVTDTARGTSTKLFNIYGGASGTATLFSVDNTGSVLSPGASGSIKAGNNLYAGFTTAAGVIGHWTRGAITFNGDGIWEIANNNANDFGRLQLGGTTSSFPAIKRSAATLAFRLADDSADAAFSGSTGTLSGNLIVNGATSIIRLKGYTVATLPSGTQGDTAFVTDALAPTFLATVVGGGTVVTPVFFNGAAWVGY